jgi:hypothetical protein
MQINPLSQSVSLSPVSCLPHYVLSHVTCCLTVSSMCYLCFLSHRYLCLTISVFSELSRLSQLCPVSLDYCVSTGNCLICLHGGVCVDFFHMGICKGGLKKGKKQNYNFFSFSPSGRFNLCLKKTDANFL